MDGEEQMTVATDVISMDHPDVSKTLYGQMTPEEWQAALSTAGFSNPSDVSSIHGSFHYLYTNYLNAS